MCERERETDRQTETERDRERLSEMERQRDKEVAFQILIWNFLNLIGYEHYAPGVLKLR